MDPFAGTGTTGHAVLASNNRHDWRASALEKTGRKLLSIEAAKPTTGRLFIRLVSEGRWSTEVVQEDSAGYTVWGRKQDNSLRAIHVDSVEDAVKRLLAKASN